MTDPDARRAAEEAAKRAEEAASRAEKAAEEFKKLEHRDAARGGEGQGGETED